MIRFFRKAVFVVALIIFTLASCVLTKGLIKEPETPAVKEVSIKEVKDNEETFKKESVIVKGIVTDEQKLPFREDGLYRIFDADGESLWIYSEKIPLPERGAKIQVQGKLRKKDDIRKKLMGPVLIEEERK